MSKPEGQRVVSFAAEQFVLARVGFCFGGLKLVFQGV